MNVRKRVAILTCAAGILIPSTALAQPPPRPTPPGSPPGHETGQADRPEEANEPTTGPINRYEHLNRP